MVALAGWFATVAQFLQPEYARIALLGLGQTIVFAPVELFLILEPDERSLLTQALWRDRRVAEKA
jgi:hypothetical protein